MERVRWMTTNLLRQVQHVCHHGIATIDKMYSEDEEVQEEYEEGDDEYSEASVFSSPRTYYDTSPLTAEDFEQHRLSPEVARQRLDELVSRLVLHGQNANVQHIERLESDSDESMFFSDSEEEYGEPLTRSPKREEEIEGDKKRETLVKKTTRSFVTGMKNGEVVIETVPIE